MVKGRKIELGYAEGLRMMANLAVARTTEDVLAQTELIGLYLLGAAPRRIQFDAQQGVLLRLEELEGVIGGALLVKLGSTTIAWTGRRFTDGEMELLAPLIPVALAALDRLGGSPHLPTVAMSQPADAQIAALMAQLPDPVWVMDPNLRLIAFNEAFVGYLQHSFGMAPTLGASVLAIPEPYRTAHLKIYQSVMKYGPRRMDWETLDGALVYDVYMHPIRTAGTVHGVAVICRDVTVARTQARDLERARVAADRANQAKSDFLAQMSHEIRTPLNAIIGLTDLVLSASPPDGIADSLDRVRLNSRVLLHLVSGVLDFSRIESGKLEVNEAPVDLRLLVHEAVDLLRSRAADLGLALTLDIQADLPDRVRTDGDRVRQILVNLIDNALKYTPAGSVQVRVRAEDGLLFEVEDTGLGIPESDLERVFTRFERLADPRNVGGAGLGLSIAVGLARALGGTLAADSTPGAGSVFRLRLPLQVVRWGGQPAAAQSGYLRRPLRILVVDDAPTNLAVTSILLRTAGHQVVCEVSGEAAIERMHDEFDLVLMDVSMPGIGGLEATRQIRALGWEVPVLALTAHAVVEVVQACLQAGMQGSLVKPIPAATLEEEVLRYARPVRIHVVHPDPAVLDRAASMLRDAGASVYATTVDEPAEEPNPNVRIQGSDCERPHLIGYVEELLRGAGVPGPGARRSPPE